MTSYLCFQLYGPLASWGDVAVGDMRPSHAHPTKSAVLGLVAAALGIERSRDDDHCALHAEFGFAVHVRSPGELLRDFHTSQVGGHKKYRNAMSRKDELDVERPKDLQTMLSQREYRVDAFYVVALWSRTDAPRYELPMIARALERPTWSLYLGRKSCPLAYPLNPQLVETPNLSGAFHRYETPELLVDSEMNDREIYWEGSADQEGIEHIDSNRRYDSVTSRQRWQFASRNEHRGYLHTGGE